MNTNFKKQREDWGDSLDVRFYLSKKLQKIKNKNILDIGCGKGSLLIELDDSNNKYGIEIDENRLKIAKQNAPKTKLIKASMYKLPFKNEYFDIVICANVLPGCDFPVKEPRFQKKFQEKLFKEINRVLKKDGKIYFTTPNNSYYKTNKARYNEITELFSGFEKFAIQGWNPFLPFPYFVPARILVKIPGWFQLLEFISERQIARKTSKFFYVEAAKSKKGVK